MTTIYIIDKVPPMWKPAGIVVALLAALFITIITTRYFLTGTDLLEVAALVAYCLLAIPVVVDYLRRTHFARIESSITPEQTKAWVHFAEYCGTNTAGAAQAIKEQRERERQAHEVVELTKRVAAIPTGAAIAPTPQPRQAPAPVQPAQGAPANVQRSPII